MVANNDNMTRDGDNMALADNDNNGSKDANPFTVGDPTQMEWQVLSLICLNVFFLIYCYMKINISVFLLLSIIFAPYHSKSGLRSELHRFRGATS